jgi:hypothetical protein
LAHRHIQCHCKHLGKGIWPWELYSRRISPFFFWSIKPFPLNKSTGQRTCPPRACSVLLSVLSIKAQKSVTQQNHAGFYSLSVLFSKSFLIRTLNPTRGNPSTWAVCKRLQLIRMQTKQCGICKQSSSLFGTRPGLRGEEDGPSLTQHHIALGNEPEKPKPTLVLPDLFLVL